MFTLKGRLTDIRAKRIYAAEITVEKGRILAIAPMADDGSLPYILPGFVDAHVHIESSMLIPAEFARLACVHGTVGTVSDPHEIANVCGIAGVEYMIENGKTVPFSFHFGAPSCVPATIFESAGATIDAVQVEELLKREDILYLSEMMNFPGVLNHDPEVLKKIGAALRAGKPVDGHAPGLRGEQAGQYIAAGISTDHECFTAEEALDKLQQGMKILIREGSAAKNFDALIGLLADYPDQMMFCSDDKHPDSLAEGHIDRLCARAVARGIDPFSVLKAACVNPVLHYRLPIGLLQPGDAADLILVEDLKEFRVLQTYVRGELVAENGRPVDAAFGYPKGKEAAGEGGQKPINNFHCEPRTAEDFQYPLDKWGEEENVEQVYVIEALEGQLITNKLLVPVTDTLPSGGLLHSNISKDLLKMVVVNRYRPAPVAKTFVKNFGLKKGAMASSVAHDSHNILAVGVDDESLCRAVNLVIAQQGGISCCGEPGEPEWVLPLPVAGLMSEEDGYKVAGAYMAIDAMAKSLGSGLSAPFMTLSFMALLVIPHLKLSDLGLFDGDGFRLI